MCRYGRVSSVVSEVEGGLRSESHGGWDAFPAGRCCGVCIRTRKDSVVYRVWPDALAICGSRSRRIPLPPPREQPNKAVTLSVRWVSVGQGRGLQRSLPVGNLSQVDTIRTWMSIAENTSAGWATHMCRKGYPLRYSDLSECGPAPHFRP